jgi:hypothetical protein
MDLKKLHDEAAARGLDPWENRGMMNKAMQRKLERSEAMDLSWCPRLGPYYVLTPADAQIDGKDLCDKELEAWMWSAGRTERAFQFEHDGVRYLVAEGTLLVSTSADLYQRDGIECVWLR